MRRSQTDRRADAEGAFVQRFRQSAVDRHSLFNGFRAVAALVLRAWLRIYHRFEIVGHEQLRTNRSLVIVANHCSHLDTLCLLAALPLTKLRHAFPAAASDYFFRRVPRTWMVAMINALPFGRRAHVRRSLSICSEVIGKPGNILIIFPEGTRSTTGEMQRFKIGIAALVAGRDVTVVPCCLEGAHRAWPKGQRFPRPRKIRLIVGPPRTYVSCGSDRTDLCFITCDLHDAIQNLGRAS
ncbi:MAG: lysophospholipid acyltransferase family protein [Chthoniobacterales bacterium]